MYFGDAGSSAVLHSLGAAHAACAVITLDTPGACLRISASLATECSLLYSQDPNLPDCCMLHHICTCGRNVQNYRSRRALTLLVGGTAQFIERRTGCAGANYRSVWALHKHFPNVKIYVRAHDVMHGLNLEKV